METTVVIVGAGPSGLATSVCLSRLCIQNVVLEKEHCSASLWKMRSYNRLHLHTAKQYCALPYGPHDSNTPTFMSRRQFINYIDNYTSQNNINPHYGRCVQSATYDESSCKWTIEAKNIILNEIEFYIAKFLIVATGENGVAFIPQIPGLDGFDGEIIHSSQYKCGVGYEGKEVLIVGSGNSGMEISYDLSDYGAHASIVIRSQLHIVTKELIYLGMWLLRYLPMKLVDALITILARIYYGDLSKFGINRPSEGPFSYKLLRGKTPVIDVGTIEKIRFKEIQVVPEIVRVDGDMVEFVNGSKKHFDAIVFATGYRSVAHTWLKNYLHILNEDGMPRNPFPRHWKGENGTYCVGLSRNGISGVSADALSVANDINSILSSQHRELWPNFL